MRLTAEYTASFKRDANRLKRKHVDLKPLNDPINLVLLNTPESIAELKRRHNMHTLNGQWSGNKECHVANSGDWLVVWREGNGMAVFQRTGSHNEIFMQK